MTILVKETDFSDALAPMAKAGWGALADALQQRTKSRIEGDRAQQYSGALERTLQQFEESGGDIRTPEGAVSFQRLSAQNKIPQENTSKFLSSIPKASAGSSKVLNRVQTDFITSNMKSLSGSSSSQADIERLRELSTSLEGVTGYAKAAWGSENATEFNNLGVLAIKPVLDIFNPRGTIPQKKIEMLLSKFAVKASDNKQTIAGKINALELLNAKGLEMGDSFQRLANTYGENIPLDEMIAFERAGSTTVDNMLKSKPSDYLEKEEKKSPQQQQQQQQQQPSEAFSEIAANMPPPSKEQGGKVIRDRETGEIVAVARNGAWVQPGE